MSSTFGGIEIGKKSLQAQRQALEVTGHNIANANTEGYSRQRVNMSATTPLNVYGTGAGQIGTGVEVSSIQQIRDRFIDEQLRKELGIKGKWEKKSEALEKMELIFNEPSDHGLRKMMSEFWNSLNSLSSDNEFDRAAIRENALGIVDTFHHFNKQITEYQTDLNEQVKTTVDDINSYAERISDLNKEIIKAEGTNQAANDLRDKRNLLVEQLSEITNIQVSEGTNSALQITIGGQYLVSGQYYTKLSIKEDSSNNNFYKVEWEDGNPATFKNGKIKGLLDSRDVEVANYKNKLDTMAESLVKEFNAIHRKGYGLNDLSMSEIQSNTLQDISTPLSGNEGQFDIVVNGTSTYSITINSGDSLGDIRDKINSAAMDVDSNGTNDVVASLVDSDGDGSDDSLNIAVTDAGTKLELVNKSDINNGQVNVIEELGLKGVGAGRDFFTGSTAEDIGLSADITGPYGLKNIALATKAADSDGDGKNDYAGDGKIALDLANLGTEKINDSTSPLDGTTFSDYYTSTIVELGLNTQRAERMISNQEVLTQNLKQQRESVSGVSLDEEMTEMIKYQHAYTAAAKVVSTLDEMLGVLVNDLKR